MHNSLKPLLVCGVLLTSIIACAGETQQQARTETPAASRPNILLIVVDDMGYSDLGSFGGEIDTPNLDSLAMSGIRFSNFHAAPMCSPSRAMLMTGVDAHAAGFGNMLEELSPNQKGQPGYEGYLNDRVVTVATLLKDSGYRTYLTGKWHLGMNDTANPTTRGFARSFVLGPGGASHFADMRPAYAPSPDVKADYWEDGVKLAELPREFNYSSQFYVDRMIDYLAEHDGADEPFFAYLSFTAPHWPLQAPDDAIARQAGRYDNGYDALARRRLDQLRKRGLVPQTAGLSERSPKERPWDNIDDEQRRIERRAMEVYAAMVAEVDRHTGRLLEFLGNKGLDDNTVIIFLSDNGAEGHDLDETWPMEAFPAIRKTIDTVHDFSYENMGRVASYTLIGPNWANATQPHLRLHKGFPTEGGTRVAAFVNYPALTQIPSISDDFVSVKDVAPTILELAGIDLPGDRYKGRPIEQMTGESFGAILAGEARDDSTRVIGVELMGKRAIRKGEWKLVHMQRPWGQDDWALFNLDRDISESTDVSAEFPEKTTELMRHWQEYAEANKVIIPDWVSGY